MCNNFGLNSRYIEHLIQHGPKTMVKHESLRIRGGSGCAMLKRVGRFLETVMGFTGDCNASSSYWTGLGLTSASVVHGRFFIFSFFLALELKAQSRAARSKNRLFLLEWNRIPTSLVVILSCFAKTASTVTFELY